MFRGRCLQSMLRLVVTLTPWTRPHFKASAQPRPAGRYACCETREALGGRSAPREASVVVISEWWKPLALSWAAARGRGP